MLRLGLLMIWGCFSPSPPAAAAPCGLVQGEPLLPSFDGADASREQVKTRLVPVLGSCEQVTDLQPVPGRPEQLVVLQKTGELRVVDLNTGAVSLLKELTVRTRSEQGLLGLAFHPKFEQNGRLYLHYVSPQGSQGRSVVQGFTVDPKQPLGSSPVTDGAVVLELDQPFANHDAGQLAFGPDGMLYIGFGDGGSANDPLGSGQDGSTWLGAMLRVDVDTIPEGKGYGIPADNPFVGKPEVRDEIWALGLRNPWRYSFAPDGRLIVGDVGQNLYEEVSFVERGANLGWKVREAAHCFEPKEGCLTEGLVDPIYEYDHTEGISITGGFVWTAPAPSSLSNHYVFGDFGTGRLWAIPLPEGNTLVKAQSLGHYDVNPSTFGRLADGTLLVAGFSKGVVYRLEAL